MIGRPMNPDDEAESIIKSFDSTGTGSLTFADFCAVAIHVRHL